MQYTPMNKNTKRHCEEHVIKSDISCPSRIYHLDACITPGKPILIFKNYCFWLSFGSVFLNPQVRSFHEAKADVFSGTIGEPPP